MDCTAFDINIPYTDITLNPFGPSASANSAKSFRIPGQGVASFARRIAKDGHYVLVYHLPGSKRAILVFSQSAIKLETVVRVTNRGDERRQANAEFGKPADYDWSAEYGEPHTWHHDWRRGSMQLVPRSLNQGVGHVGRRMW